MVEENGGGEEYPTPVFCVKTESKGLAPALCVKAHSNGLIASAERAALRLKQPDAPTASVVFARVPNWMIAQGLCAILE